MFFDRKSILNKLNKQSVVVGYDLGEAYAQISVAGLNGEEPVTLSTVAGEEQFAVPMVLCKRKEVNQWFYGKEAIRNGEAGEGILIDRLWEKALDGTMVSIEDMEISPIELLTLFIKKSFSMLGAVSMSNVAAIMITVDHLDERKVQVLMETINAMKVKEGSILFQSHEESAFFYIQNQPVDLRRGETGILDFTGRELKTGCLCTNTGTIPHVSYMEEAVFPEESKQNDEALLVAATQLCRNRNITSVYMIGDEFQEENSKKSLGYLCMGRRVFRGNNLYSKGACYSMLERVKTVEQERDTVFLGSDKLKSNIGMEVENESGYHVLLNAGENWYDARTEVNFLLDSGNTVSILITPLYGTERKRADVILSGIPIRTRKTTRIHMEIGMKSETVLQVSCKDMGFGDIFKSSEQEWTKEFEI